MSDIKLAFAYLKSRLLVTVLTILAVSLGLALGTIVLSLSHQVTDTLTKEAGLWDVMVGAKGDPLELVLNGLYYMEAPTGNFNVAIWKKIQQDPSVSAAVPLTMGDNYFGWPIVGTVPAFFDGFHPASGTSIIASGRQLKQTVRYCRRRSSPTRASSQTGTKDRQCTRLGEKQ